MEEEIEQLKRNMMVEDEETIAGTLFIKGTLQNQSVILLKSGIGKVNAAMAATILHERYQPEYVINTGSAGGFASQLEVGDIVVSTKVAYHDVDVTAFNYEYGQIPGMPTMYTADQNLVDEAMEAVGEATHANAAKGIIATGDAFMQDQARVDFVREKFPEMIAAEMEAAAITQVCYKYGTPFVVIRALSDIAGKTSSISFDQFLGKAAAHATEIIMTMLSKR